MGHEPLHYWTKYGWPQSQLLYCPEGNDCVCDCDSKPLGVSTHFSSEKYAGANAGHELKICLFGTNIVPFYHGTLVSNASKWLYSGIHRCYTWVICIFLLQNQAT